MMDTNTSLRVARMLGEVRLQLPQQFRQELDGAIDRGLARMPSKSRHELKDLVAASVAITLRASDFSEIMESEFLRLKEAEAVKAESMEWQHLEALKNKYSDAVKPFEAVMYNRRTSADQTKAAHTSFLDAVCLLSESESIPLIEWADELLEKRQKLRGYNV